MVQEWKELFEYFVVGKVEFGDYFDHVLSWCAHKDDDNVLFLKFEDMKQELLAAVEQIATFLGYASLSQDVLKTIVEKTSFDKIRPVARLFKRGGAHVYGFNCYNVLATRFGIFLAVVLYNFNVLLQHVATMY